MNTRIQWMSRNQSSMNITAPNEEELNTIIGYLLKRASAESE
jgi:hypothetical protein